MSDAYQLLAADLAADGIRCYFQARGQLVISQQQEPCWPDQGNSFWVTHAKGCWYLFTWSPTGYRVTEPSKVADLCRACMAQGSRAMAVVPGDVAHAFGLVQLSSAEMEAVYRLMKSGTE